MNILMVHPHDLFDKSEPWTIRIVSIARKFVQRGNKVKLCYFPLTVNMKHHSAEIEKIEMIPFDRTPSPMSFVVNIKKFIDLCKWADIVHLQKCHHYSAIPVVLSAYVTGRPLHYDWDDWEEKIWYESCGKKLHSRFIGFSFRVLERFLPVLADSVSCASKELRNLTSKFGVAQEFIFDTPVGADLERFKPGLDGGWVKAKYGVKSNLVLYLGQLHGAQYVDLFIKAANVVLQHERNVKFMIVGEGSLELQLRELVYEWGLEEQILFTGAVNHDDIPYYISAADICVAPFRDTDVTRCKSPLKIVEYLASGKPIVASLVGETRSMVGGAGVLVHPGDSRLLAEGILKLLKDEELRVRLSKFARIRAERKYNWEYTSKSLLSAYEKILKS